MSRNEWVTPHDADPITATINPRQNDGRPDRFPNRQGKRIRTPIAPANILRLPAAGSKECDNTYFMGYAATLRARQETASAQVQLSQL
jgi:hypothetical protein